MLKQLTGKNPHDYESAAKHLMDNTDAELFAELVEKDSFLFDFVKQNVAQRLSNATNDKNWQTVFSLLKYYSPSYEEFICSTLVKYADDDVTDKMLSLLESGTTDEKIYCAKFFSYIQDPLSINLLKNNLYTDNEYLNTNCAMTLSAMKEESSYNEALKKLKSKDNFEQLDAVKFLVNYGNKKALPEIINILKISPLAENIAGEIPYLEGILNILDENFENGLLILNYIINGLGEILPLSQVFDYDLYNVFDYLLTKTDDSRVATVILNACEKFETLTENDEYLFDEDKNTKNEIFDIKKLIYSCDKNKLLTKTDEELHENSLFVYTALDFSTNVALIKELLKCNNQTLILKTAEILKKLNNLDSTAKNTAMLNITNDNIKAIICAL